MNQATAAKLKIFASMFIFGTVGVFVRFIPLPSEIVALSRGVIGALFLLLVVLIRGGRILWEPIRKNLLWLLLSGTALGFNWILFFEAQRFTSVAIGTLCYYMAPIFIIIVSPFLLKERLTVKKSVCVVLALIGMICISGVIGGKLPGGSELKGIIFGLMAAVLYASIVLMNKQIKGISAYDKTILQLAISAVTLVPYILLTTDPAALDLSSSSVPMLILVGVLHTGLAYYLYFGSMEHVSGQTAAVISYVDPAVAVLASIFVLGEPMKMIEAFGAVLIIGAALMSEVTVSKKGKASV